MIPWHLRPPCSDALQIVSFSPQATQLVIAVASWGDWFLIAFCLTAWRVLRAGIRLAWRRQGSQNLAKRYMLDVSYFCILLLDNFCHLLCGSEVGVINFDYRYDSRNVCDEDLVSTVQAL